MAKFSFRTTYKRVLLVRLQSSLVAGIGHPRNRCIPWRLKYIEALLLNKNIETKLIDLLTTPLPLKRLLEVSIKWRPDFLIISSTSQEYLLTLEYAVIIKEKIKNILIIAVGQDPTTSPAKYLFANSPFDLILPGEAEIRIISLLDKLKSMQSVQEIKRIFINENKENINNLSFNLDNLPFPCYSKGELSKYRLIYPLRINKNLVWGQILSSRGCIHKCIFCSPVLRYSYGSRFRTRSAENIVNEIEYLIRCGANIIAFEDDNFTGSQEHVISVCHQIRKKKLRIKWISHARVDEINKELLKIMKESGCVLLRIGVESGSQRIIKILNKCNDNIDWAQRSRAVVREAKSLGIMINAMFIIGSPSETEEDIRLSIDLARELDPDMIQVSFFTPYPDSPAYQMFEERVDKRTLSKMYHYYISQVNLSNIDDNNLLKFQKVFYKEFLFNPGFVFNYIRKHFLFHCLNPKITLELIKTKNIFLS